MAAYATAVGTNRGHGYSAPDFAIVTEDGGRYEFVYPTASYKAPIMTQRFLEAPMVSRIASDLWPSLDRLNGKDLVTLFLANTIFNVDGPTEHPDWDTAMIAAKALIPTPTSPPGG